MSNVVVCPSSSRVHPDGLLEAARNANLKKVVVIGWTETGDFYCCGSEQIETVIYLMRNAEFELFRTMEKAEEAARG